MGNAWKMAIIDSRRGWYSMGVSCILEVEVALHPYILTISLSILSIFYTVSSSSFPGPTIYSSMVLVNSPPRFLTMMLITGTGMRLKSSFDSCRMSRIFSEYSWMCYLELIEERRLLRMTL